MKIKIHKLGIVEDADIDLKPMTIFIGPNNSGKTWSAYALSAILGPHGWNEYTEFCSVKEIQEMYPPLEPIIQQILDEGSTTIDVVQFAERYGEKYFNEVAHLAPRWMHKFMGTQRTSFENLTVHMELAETKKYFLDKVLQYSLSKGLSMGKRRKKALLNAVKEQGKSTLYFYTEESLLDNLPIKVVKEFLFGSIFEILHRSLYPYIYTLPTERTTFIAFPFKERKQNEKPTTISKTSKLEQSDTVTVHPVSYFLEMILTALESNFSEREEEAKNNPSIRYYIELAHILEKDILRGEVDFSASNPESSRELIFQPSKSTALEMPVVSSMVKELSPLVLYLRYLAEPGEWLIIDEPEMNLHPQAQARLIEFLAMLVNADIHILFTTHSPYMVDHLVNLMKAAEYEGEEKIQEKFYLKKREAFISKEQVSVCLFNKGTTRSILGKDGIIDWKTFSGVSDQINQIYFELEETY